MLHPTQTPCNVLLTIQTHRSVTSYKKHIQLIASYNKSVINFRKQSSFTTLAKMARVVSEMTVLYVADMDTRRSKYQLNITLAFRDLTQLDNRLGIWPVKNLASASPNGSSWAIYDRQECVSEGTPIGHEQRHGRAMLSAQVRRTCIQHRRSESMEQYSCCSAHHTEHCYVQKEPENIFIP